MGEEEQEEVATSEPEENGTPAAGTETPPPPESTDEGREQGTEEKTREDASKAYFQAKSQDLEDDFKELMASLDIGVPQAQPAPPPPKPKIKSEGAEDDRLSQLESKLDTVLQSLTMQQQQALQQQWQAEVKNANAVVASFARKRGITREKLAKLDEEVGAFITESEFRQPGGPTRYAKALGSLLQREALLASGEKLKTERSQQDERKIADMQKTLQPKSGATMPPQADSPEKLNQQLADEIAPDDVPFISS